MSVLVWPQRPTAGSCGNVPHPNQTTSCQQASQKKPEGAWRPYTGADWSLVALPLAHPPPYRDLRTGASSTDKDRMDLQPAAGPWGGQPGARGCRREGPLFSLLKGGLRKAGSMIFPRSLSRAREREHLCCGLCSGCGSGHSLGLASAKDSPVWRRLRPAGPWVGPLAGQLMRAATGLHPGDREPEPGRGARKGLRLRCQWLSQSTVCAKGLEKALATQQVDPGATAPSPQAPGPRAPPFPPLLFKTGLCGYLSVLPACSSRLQSNADITRPGLLILPLTLFCHLVHH